MRYAMNLEILTESELRDLMNRCARAVKSVLGQKSQFALIVFDDPKVAQYVSTCTRETMIEALKETVHRLEHKDDVTR